MTGEIDGIGLLLKKYRQAHGATQREVAAAAGMSIGALRDLEQGRTRFPRWGIVEELAAVLGLGQAQRAELAKLAKAGRAVGAGAGRPRREPRHGIRLQVLGPLTAWRNGTPVELGSGRQRAVLGLLALHYDTGLHRNAIVDLLWGERPPASAVTEVQGYVSRLRKLLSHGSQWGAIATLGGRSYHLSLGAGQLQLDLTAFRQSARTARSEPDRAFEMYEQALGAWRGDLLADVDLLHGHPAAIEVTRERAEAVLGYAEAAMRAGIPGRALPQLRSLCATEPLNEPAHARLMVALAATGQQTFALRVFAELRARLDAEFGIAPSPVLARAQTAVLRQAERGRADGAGGWPEEMHPVRLA